MEDCSRGFLISYFIRTKRQLSRAKTSNSSRGKSTVHCNYIATIHNNTNQESCLWLRILMIKLTMTFYDSLGFDFSVHQCNLFGKCSRIALFISNRHTLNLQKPERFNFKYDLNSFFIIHKVFFNEWMYSIQSMNVLQLNKF